MKLGIFIYEWSNHNTFISVLQKAIKDNQHIIKNYQTLIKNNLSVWSRNQVELKIWQSLNAKNKSHMLRIKKIQEQINIDECIQLKILKKGLLF